MLRFTLVSIMLLAMLAACGGQKTAEQKPSPDPALAQLAADSLLRPGEEKHLRNVRQLTFGGQNAEAYFSYDAGQICLQSTRDSFNCDQIFLMNSDGSNVHLASTGKGRTTCSFISPDGKKLIYASTHLADPACPPPPDMSRGYVWAVYPGYDIFQCNLDGSDLVRLTDTPGYDAECVYSPDGSKIIFTSLRDGDLDLYTMNADGSNVQRVTSELGYDGGAFFSFDNQWICYRAYHPETDSARAEYLSLLKRNEIKPSELELFIARADGSDKRQITHLGRASFCPYFYPDGKRLIFASNHHSGSRNFDLFLINVDGTGLEQVTFNDSFDGFPMFSHDGQKLVFASNRHGRVPGETNIFIADWVN